ncbi:MAG: hypothetical protein V3W18_06785 [candidate division Zixibacteria bacterium]
MRFILPIFRSWKLSIILVFLCSFQILIAYFWIDLNSILNQEDKSNLFHISANDIYVPTGMHIQNRQYHGGSGSLNAVYMISRKDYIIVSDLKDWDSNKIDVYIDDIRSLLTQKKDLENNYFYLFSIEADDGWGYHYLDDSNSDIVYENIFIPSRNLHFSITGKRVDFDAAIEYLKEMIYFEADTLTWDVNNI